MDRINMKKPRTAKKTEKNSENSTSKSSSTSDSFGDFAFLSPLQGIAETFQLILHVKPNAKNNCLKIDDSQLIVSITAPATKGKANKALINLMAQDLHISKSQLNIVRGHTSHTKIVQIKITKIELMQKMKSIQKIEKIGNRVN